MTTEPGKKKKRRIWWLVAAALGVLLVVGFVFDPFGSMGLKEELARARAAGFPVEPEDIFLDPAPRDEDNAALVFDEIVDIVASTSAFSYEKELHVRAVVAGYDDFDIELVDKYFKDNAEVFLLAERAAALPAYRAEKDWSNPWEILLPEFAVSKQITRALAARAMLSLDEGDVEAALTDLRRILQIANRMEDSAFLIGNLVAIANRMIYASTVEKMAAFPEANDIFLAGVVSQLRYWPEKADWTQAMRTEAHSAVWAPQNFPEIEGAIGPSWTWRDGFPSHESDWEDVSWRMRSTRMKAARLGLLHWTDILNSYDPDDDDPIGWARRMDARLPTGSGFWKGAEVLAYIITYELEGVATSEVRMRARREVLKSSLEALLAMRNGAQDPFKNLGLDPFTGASLLYKKTKDGFLIYSVDQDGVDDGGLAVRTSGHSDIVFEYPKKRQPAPPDFYKNGF